MIENTGIPHTNLPVQLTNFVGRELELTNIKGMLSGSRLVTLTGAGGCGKTRLAIHVASNVVDEYADGVWWVDLVPLHEPALLPQLVAQTLGMRPTVEQPQQDALLEFLSSKQTLLILDNCEHISSACAQLAQELLSQVSDLRILATSRIPLAIVGETIYPVSGLNWPVFHSEAAWESDLQDFMGYDAIQLFVERAHAISPGFKLTPENAGSIIEICRRLDGLPLALELASARINVLTVQEIAARLQDRFTLLISSQRTGLEPRHHTLRAAIDWSYAMLTAAEQVFLSRLAVFSAGWTLDMAEVVCMGKGIEGGNTLNLLSSLVDKSLIIAETTSRSQARYRLLETIREYALEKLDEAGEKAQLRDRHLNLFLTRAEEAAPKLSMSYQQLWLNWLEGEHDNLRAALAWSLEDTANHRRIEAGMRIACALARFWEIRGYVQEGMIWFERLLPLRDEQISPTVRVNALVYASFLAMFLEKTQAALTYGQEAVDIAEGLSHEDNPLLTFALSGLASGARSAGDYQTTFTIGERVIQFLRASPDTFELGMGLLSQGDVAMQLGSFDMARERLDESLALAQAAGDSFRIAHALNTLGDLARCERKYLEAQTSYEKSAALLRELGAQHDLASIINNLGYTYLHQGDVEQAQALFLESMSIHQAQENRPGMKEVLIGFAGTAILTGQPAAGVRLLAVAAADSGQPTASLWRATRMEADYFLQTAQSSLPEAEFLAEMAAGQNLSLEQAVDFAVKLPYKPEIEPPIGDSRDGLTRREREVTRLIGQGRTNSEIAAELVLSKRTVETHVSNILSKLDLPGRAQIMRWAMDHDLT